jgi:hypothetical protein
MRSNRLAGIAENFCLSAALSVALSAALSALKAEGDM